MKPLAELAEDRARDVKAVFTDIDDTLTSDGRLEREAFDALWRLHEAGMLVVPVTGRPAGWCDHFARMWPVDAVIGENGALAYRYDRTRRRMQTWFAQDEEERQDGRRRLAAVRQEILRAVPGAGIASDQAFRLFDLAIDFCEDVPPLPRSDVDRIVALFEAAGATAKVSSIHVNGWFGSFDKLSMIRLVSSVLGLSSLGDAVYIGDSPNDAPAFEAFEFSVGVANVLEFEGRMASLPKYVTPSRGGQGFAEVVDALLGTRVRTNRF